MNGRRIPSNTRLKEGDWIRTTERGTATMCLRAGDTKCELLAGTLVRFRPPKLKGALAWVSVGNITCTMSARDKPAFYTQHEAIRFGAGGSQRMSALVNGRGGSAQAATGGHAFSIVVRNRKTLVKVRRGATVVARKGNLRRAVVLGRQQQVAVLAGRDPLAPTALKLTSAERKVFQQLESSLPPDTDRTAPALTVNGPRNPSSLRSATFTFTASEAGSTFSCALDGKDFRLCVSPQPHQRVSPGPHTFAVRVSDAAGNTRETVYSWTVDGSRIAFTSGRDGNAEIYAMDPDGLNQIRLTNQPAVDAAPEWSPDRTRIAFHSERDGNSEIYVMNADGSGQTRVTTHPATDRNPTWSPDGTRIAFESYRDGNRELYAMNADGSNVRRLTTDRAEDLDPAWSPDGNRLAFASTRDGNFEIYVMNADGSGQTNLTKNPAVEFNPAWSPDGRKLAFHSLRSTVSQNIYVMNADGSAQVRLTESASDDYNPAWAPDGGSIVFQSSRDNHPRMEIYLMNADGSDETRLTTGSGNEVPDW